MDAQMKKGMLESCVLSMLLKGDSYGYLLIQQVSALMPISESTLYPVLRRLEAAGSLTVYSREHNGRLRKYYAITENGKQQIHAFLKEWETVNRVYAFIKDAAKEETHE
ncbi:MAG: PadR family transcriptional regulator [Clostridia bacterium]|nr:PadR family transcriptional regulator [Clostridia bacterium]